MGELEELLQPEEDDRISAIFRHFEALTTLASGRTVGRKIGVAQEILLKKYLEGAPELRRRMYIEQLLEGRSGASHKVEFSWYALTAHEGLSPGDEVPGTGLHLDWIDVTGETVGIGGDWKGKALAVGAAGPVKRTGPLREALAAQGKDIRLVRADGETVDLDVIDRARLLASLESKRVGAQRFAGSDKLGAGIQTIEKAKQASLVAIDLDLRHNNNVKALEEPGTEKQLLSFVALGNGVHWTKKDRAILGTYVDFTFLVRDDGIIRYAKFVQEQAHEDDDPLEVFMSYFKGLTKQPEDDFAVGDDDFEIIVPEGEERALRRVLLDHVKRVNP